MEKPPIVNLDHPTEDHLIARKGEEQHNRIRWERFQRFGLVAISGASRINLEELNILLIKLEDENAAEKNI